MLLLLRQGCSKPALVPDDLVKMPWVSDAVDRSNVDFSLSTCYYDVPLKQRPVSEFSGAKILEIKQPHMCAARESFAECTKAFWHCTKEAALRWLALSKAKFSFRLTQRKQRCANNRGGKVLQDCWKKTRRV